MRIVLVLALLAACRSKPVSDDPAQARKNYVHTLEEGIRKAGGTQELTTRGDDASTIVVAGPCDHDYIEGLALDAGDDLRRKGFISIECALGESIMLTKPSGGGSDPWAQ